MLDAEWTLDYEGVSFTFGSLASGAVFTAAPEVGHPEVQNDDKTRPRADGRAFGQDFLGGSTITFEAEVVKPDEDEAHALAAAFKAAWRGDRVRRTPGAVARLTARRNGRERVVYGRPRRFAQDDEWIEQGAIAITADFACVDDVSYSPERFSTDVAFVPPPSGGMLAPLAAPLSTVQASSTPGGVSIGGDLAAWPIITISGPITNPVVQVTNEWDLELRTTIAGDQALVIDTRPWKRTITRQSDGASFAGALARTSVPLSKAFLEPGDYEVALRGADETGTASMRFAWHDTYSTL